MSLACNEPSLKKLVSGTQFSDSLACNTTYTHKSTPGLVVQFSSDLKINLFKLFLVFALDLRHYL